MEDILYEEDEQDQRNVINSTPSNDKHLKYPIMTNDDRLICQVCGKNFKCITQSHLKFHGLTPNSYRDIYKTPLVTEKHKKLLSLVNKQKYKNVFKDHEDKKPEQEIPIEDMFDNQDGIDAISFDQKFNDIMPAGKKDPMYTRTEIAYNLEDLFPDCNTKENFFIEESSGSGAFPGTMHLKYSFITDITIPERKIAFFFPDTFWHNRELADDPNKYSKLSEDGWTPIIIKGNNPTIEQIKKELRKSNLI